jgi:hypothetical protein
MAMRKTFVYFLCFSFVLLASGFHTAVTEGREINRPIGEMISKGDVEFESRANVWKRVDPSAFPVFQGVRIKVEKGASAIFLRDNSQIEVGQNTIFSFDHNDQMHLTQGAVYFRIPPTAEVSFKVGNLTVIQSKSLQASQNPSAVFPKSEAAIGSITVHTNGSITVKSLQGSLSIVNQERMVLASLSSKDTVTLPSITVKSPPKVMVAQAGETTSEPEEESKEFLGIGTWGWIGIAGGVGAVAIVVVAASGGGGGHHGGVVCP